MDWVELTKWAIASVGVPFVCFILLALAVAWVGRFTATELIRPLLARHIIFLDHLQARLDEQTKTQEQQTVLLAKIEIRLEKHIPVDRPEPPSGKLSRPEE